LRRGSGLRKLRPMTHRVLHVDTERAWRGGERQVVWLARELARRGHGSIVAARTNEPLAARAEDDGLDVVMCNPKNEMDPVAAWKLRRVIRERGITVVHAHTAHAVAVAGIATLGTSVPLVVSRRVDFRLRDNIGTRWKYGRATAIIAISDAVARVLEECGIQRSRIFVVADGVDMHRAVQPMSRERLKSLGVPTTGPLIVQVAQLVGHKDPVNFVRAIAALRSIVPDAQALMVGEGPLRFDVEREIEQLELHDLVHLAGYRTDADEILAAANVATLSSREEGMGSVLLDALAFGLPIAATAAGGIPEVIVNEQSGLLAPPADPVALGNAIGRLINDPALAMRLAGNARRRAEDFSVERMTDRTVAVYDAVTGGGVGRARINDTSSSSSASVTGAS
jgi:glycosyltransferase involved in cell wall biosynthesis